MSALNENDCPKISENIQSTKQSQTASKSQDINSSNFTLCDEKTFAKRQGTGNAKGLIYKTELSMLFLLEGQIGHVNGRIKGFHLASNMEEAADFKDVIFRYRYSDHSAKESNKKEKSKIIFLHSMHVEEPKKKKITADVFLSEEAKKEENYLVISLEKHFSSFRAIKQQFSKQEQHPIFGSSFEDSEFLIYTNALATFSGNDMIKQISVDRESILYLHGKQGSNSYYKIMFGDGEIKNEEEEKSVIIARNRIISILQESSDCRKLSKELAKAVFLTKDGKNPEIVHQGILKKYHLPLSQTVVMKTTPNAKYGEFSVEFLDCDENLSEESKDFRKEFFEEGKRITQKTEFDLKQQLRGIVIKLCEKFGVDDGNEENSLPNDRVNECEIKEFFSKLKLFTGQPSEDHLAELIKEKIKLGHTVEEKDVSSIFFNVKEKLEQWWLETTKSYLTEKTRFFQDSIRIAISFDIRRPIETFTGRKQELSYLRSLLNPKLENVSGKAQMVVITGLGGVGKTELARQYIYEHSKYFDRNVIWINAESYGTLSESFLRLAQELNINTGNTMGKQKDIKSIVEEVYKYFSKRKSLFVFDSADRYETLKDYDSAVDKFLPSTWRNSKVFVVVTSCNKDWGNIKTLPLDNLTDEEAAKFIRYALNIERGFQDEIQELFDVLKGFPLALQQAVAYILEQNKNEARKFTIKEYLQKYKKAGTSTVKDLLDYKAVDRNNYSRTVFATWTIAIQKIEKMNYGNEALQILKIMAYFASNNICTKIFLEPDVDKRRIGSALQLLKQYSIIGLDEGEGNIHKLVQEIVRTELATQGKEKEVLRDAMNLLKHVMPEKTNFKCVSHAMSVWAYTTKYEDLVRDFSSLPHKIMHELDISFRYQEASLFGGTAFSLVESVLGPNHLDTLQLMINLADSLDQNGKYNEALKFYEDLLKRCIKNFGTDNFRTLGVKSSMAATLNTIGQYDDALRTFRDVLDKRKKTLGEDHPDTLSSMNSTATVLSSMKKHSEALEIYQTVLHKRRCSLGSDHPDTLTTMHDIAVIYCSERKYDEACRTYQEVLQKRCKILGPHHPLTLLTKNHLSAALYNAHTSSDALLDYQDLVKEIENILGPDHFQSFTAKQGMIQILYNEKKYEEALLICEELLNREIKLLGHCHPCILKLHGIKAAVLFQQRKYDEAYTAYEDLLNTKRRILGHDHQETVTAMEGKAAVLMGQGKFNESLLIFQKVLEKKKQALGPNHRDTIITEINIAAFQGNQGNYKEALKTNQELLSKMQHDFDMNTQDILLILIVKQNIVAAFAELGNYDEALNICRELYDEIKQTWGPDHHQTLSAKRRVASILYLQGQYDEALITVQEVLEKGKQFLTPDHSDNLITRNSIATLLNVKGYHHIAFKTYQEVLKYRKEVDSTDDLETLETQKDMALLLCTLGKYEESLKASHAVLDEIKNVLGPVHPSALIIQNNIARVLNKQGKYAKAMKIYEDILEKCKQFLGSDHPHTLNAKNDIAELLDEQGNYDSSLEIYKEVLEGKLKLFGPNHVSTLDTKNNMARVLFNRGQYDEALEIYYEVFDKTKHILGPDNPSTLATQNNIASVLTSQGYYEEALEIYLEVLVKRKKTFCQSHPDTLSTMSNIAKIRGLQKCFGLSLEVYEDVLEKRKQALGSNHPDTLNTKNDIAGILFKQGNYEMALTVYFEVLDEMNDVLGSDHHLVFKTRSGIAKVMYNQGKYEESLQIYKEILYQSKTVLSPDHPDTLCIMDELATALYNCGSTDEAVELRKDVLDKEMKTLGRNHPLTLLTMYKLVKELYESGNYEDGLDIYLYVMNKEKLLELYRRDPVSTGNDVLHKLARDGQLEVLSYLLDNGADFLRLHGHDTLLHQAVISDNKDVIKSILIKFEEKYGDIRSYIDTPDDEGDTPLMWAAETGNANAAQILLEYGANVNVKNLNNQTALHWAAKGGYQDIAEMLLDNQADSSIIDINGLTALGVASEKLENDMKILQEVRKDLKIVAALLHSVSQATE